MYFYIHHVLNHSNTVPLRLCHLLPYTKPGVPDLLLLRPSCLSHQVPPASAKQHGVNLSTPTTPFQQASGYGQHSYSTGKGCSQHGNMGRTGLPSSHMPLVPCYARL